MQNSAFDRRQLIVSVVYKVKVCLFQIIMFIINYNANFLCSDVYKKANLFKQNNDLHVYLIHCSNIGPGRLTALTSSFA